MLLFRKGTSILRRYKNDQQSAVAEVFGELGTRNSELGTRYSKKSENGTFSSLFLRGWVFIFYIRPPPDPRPPRGPRAEGRGPRAVSREFYMFYFLFVPSGEGRGNTKHKTQQYVPRCKKQKNQPPAPATSRR